MSELQWSHILLGINYLGWFLLVIFIVGIITILLLNLAEWIQDKLKFKEELPIVKSTDPLPKPPPRK